MLGARAIIDYIRRLGIETDVWLSVLTGGDVGETISLRVARAAAAGGRRACIVCRFLSIAVERGHCEKQLASSATAPDAALRAGLMLGPAMWLIWWLIVHVPGMVWRMLG